MATTTDKGKGLECPKSSGKDDEYQVWVTKFDAYAKVKGFYKIMAGTGINILPLLYCDYTMNIFLFQTSSLVSFNACFSLGRMSSDYALLNMSW